MRSTAAAASSPSLPPRPGGLLRHRRARRDRASELLAGHRRRPPGPVPRAASDDQAPRPAAAGIKAGLRNTRIGKKRKQPTYKQWKRGDLLTALVGKSKAKALMADPREDLRWPSATACELRHQDRQAARDRPLLPERSTIKALIGDAQSRFGSDLTAADAGAKSAIHFADRRASRRPRSSRPPAPRPTPPAQMSRPRSASSAAPPTRSGPRRHASRQARRSARARARRGAQRSDLTQARGQGRGPVREQHGARGLPQGRRGSRPAPA
jgi:hypothetical protein